VLHTSLLQVITRGQVNMIGRILTAGSGDVTWFLAVTSPLYTPGYQ